VRVQVAVLPPLRQLYWRKRHTARACPAPADLRPSLPRSYHCVSCTGARGTQHRPARSLLISGHLCRAPTTASAVLAQGAHSTGLLISDHLRHAPAPRRQLYWRKRHTARACPVPAYPRPSLISSNMSSGISINAYLFNSIDITLIPS
jgi:hypothetical protein